MFSIEILLLFMNFQSVLTVEIIANFLFLFLFTLELYFVFELKIYRRFKLFIVPYIYDIRRKYRGRHLLPIFTYLIIVIYLWRLIRVFLFVMDWQGVKLLKASLHTKNVLSTVFLGK